MIFIFQTALFACSHVIAIKVHGVKKQRHMSPYWWTKPACSRPTVSTWQFCKFVLLENSNCRGCAVVRTVKRTKQHWSYSRMGS